MSPIIGEMNSTDAGVVQSIYNINPKCLEEITQHLRTYINNYYTSTWNRYTDMSYIINECREVFNDFIDDTFEREHPEIFIEVYLVNPITLTDNVRNDICRLVSHGLNISIAPTSSVHTLLLYYTYAYAILNEQYFMTYIAQSVVPDIELTFEETTIEETTIEETTSE